MATDQLINKTQGDAIIAGLAAIKNAINDQPVPTQVEDVVSDAFDVGVSYVPGDYCIYENKLYKCDVAHHGAWDGNDFTLTNVGAELDTLNNALSVEDISYSTSIIVKKIGKLIVIYCFGGLHINGDAILPSNSPYRPASAIIVAGFNAGNVTRCGIRPDGTLAFLLENGSAITSTQACYFNLTYTI